MKNSFNFTQRQVFILNKNKNKKNKEKYCKNSKNKIIILHTLYTRSMCMPSFTINIIKKASKKRVRRRRKINSNASRLMI